MKQSWEVEVFGFSQFPPFLQPGSLLLCPCLYLRSTGVDSTFCSPSFAKVCTASVDSVDDTVQKELASLSSLDKVKIEALKKRKLVAPTSLTAFKAG